MAIEACKIGSDRSETLLNLNEFSPAKQTQLAKLFRLSTPKNMIVPKASAFGSLISLIYNYCHLHSKSVEDHHVWPFFRLLKGICAHVKDTHQRFLIYESVERYQRFLFQILKVWMWQLIWIKTEICIIISAKKVEIRMIASADQNMPEHALICKVVIFSTNSCAVHAKKMAEPWTNQF